MRFTKKNHTSIRFIDITKRFNFSIETSGYSWSIYTYKSRHDMINNFYYFDKVFSVSLSYFLLLTWERDFFFFFIIKKLINLWRIKILKSCNWKIKKSGNCILMAFLVEKINFAVSWIIICVTIYYWKVMKKKNWKHNLNGDYQMHRYTRNITSAFIKINIALMSFTWNSLCMITKMLHHCFAMGTPRWRWWWWWVLNVEYVCTTVHHISIVEANGEL